MPQPRVEGAADKNKIRQVGVAPPGGAEKAIHHPQPRSQAEGHQQIAENRDLAGHFRSLPQKPARLRVCR